jgi:hypothetical protein
MGYERIYGAKAPCKCGKGTAQEYRVEHDTFPTDTNYFPYLEVDCPDCDPGRKTWDVRDRQRAKSD